ncbi:MAG: hypothetical protein JWM27_2317, partial [Gemmatimonadetes bacterium]|nr:hypothetical protein [Gemmatimonadota bacterium]
ARRAWPRRQTLQWLVPLAAAAGVAGLMVAGPLRTHTPDPVGTPPIAAVQPAPAAGGASVEDILAATLPEHVNRVIDGQADEDALASGALGS